jgi:hypothetical protein
MAAAEAAFIPDQERQELVLSLETEFKEKLEGL